MSLVVFMISKDKCENWRMNLFKILLILHQHFKNPKGSSLLLKYKNIFWNYSRLSKSACRIAATCLVVRGRTVSLARWRVDFEDHARGICIPLKIWFEYVMLCFLLTQLEQVHRHVYTRCRYHLIMMIVL